MNTGVVIVAIIIAALGFGCLYWRRSKESEVAIMAATQTSRAADVAGIAPGTLVEVKGTIRSNAPLTGQFSQRQCVHWRSMIEREEVRYKDNQRETNYVTESDLSESIPFDVEDASGRVRVDPKGATIEARSVFEESRSSTSDNVMTVVSTLTGRGGGNTHRYREWILPPDDAIYVLGTVQPDGSIGAAPPNAKLRNFIVTYETEEERSASSHLFGQILLGVAALLFIGAAVTFYYAFN